ncbi:MAG TPA: response regulator [Beijerinckiaceae bacterium]|nr:response regulator [Beijerinckiaceae bacterium]
MTADTSTVAPGKPPSVLVVEDEVLVRLVIAEYLRLCGYRVLEAANADEAVLVLKHPDFGIGVVFTDVDMPGSMDGFGLARWVRRHRPGLAVVLAGTLARAAEAAGELCQEGPAMAKPYEPQAVADRIRRLLATQDLS